MIKKQTDYSLLLLSYLSEQKGLVPLSQLVDELKLPQRYLARIASKLAKHQILKSKEGRRGGYKLAKRLEEISLVKVLEIFEENIDLVPCRAYGYNCRWEKDCQHRFIFKDKLTAILINELSKVSLADIYNK